MIFGRSCLINTTATAEGETEMRKIHRKIVSGALLCGCALFTLYGASRIAERNEKGALPVSLTDIERETPVIVLDAGHGESA